LKRTKGRRKEEELEINLVPMIDLFVALIPFLLLTAAFVHIGGVSVSVPSVAFQKSSPAKKINEKSDHLRLTVDIKDQQILISAFTENFEKSIVELQRSFPLSKLDAMTNYLKETQFKFPKLDVALVHAAKATPYQDVVRVIEVLEKTHIFERVMLAAGVES
jgi:biopolymer transport protein ExbD